MLYLESYKLLKLASVVALIAAGAAVAGLCYFVNAYVLDRTGIDAAPYTRYVGPVVEEALKGLVMVALVRTHRVGFLVDAAIAGFAVGTGFAVVENLYYHVIVPDAGLGTWIVRGFGTAIMHGGATAIFTTMGLALQGRRPGGSLVAFVPGLAVATVLHSAFNHMFFSPAMSTLAVLVVVPPLLYAVFQRSEARGGGRVARPRFRQRRRDARNSSRRGNSPRRPQEVTSIRCAAASTGRWSPTSCATCGSSPSWRCAPRGC